MSSQYALIASQWPDLHAEAVRVEQCALSDPRTACFYARRTIELLVEWVYDNDSQLQRPPGYASLADLIFARCFIDLAGEQMRRFRLLKDLGNKAVHRREPIRPGDAVTAATIRLGWTSVAPRLFICNTMSAAFSATTRFSGEIFTPCFSIASISANRAHGSTTTPLPMTESLPGRTTPDGSRLSLKVLLPMTRVWPAL
mgnify:CR=1 FL=1